MIRKELFTCLSNLGIYINEKEENILLSDYIADSVSFIAFIVEVEQAFQIEVPDEYLNAERLTTLEDVINMVEQISNSAL